MKVIVTGFDAFGGYAANPSQEAVNLLPDIVKFDDNSAELKVAKLTLPTCCSDAWEILKKEVESSNHEPYALLLSGLADSRDKICLERFALNVRHFRMPDNNGHQWDDEYIHKDGPDALRTKLPLKQLNEELKACGFASDISNSAGTYVCNETYYRSLFQWQNDPLCRGILFVHFPAYEGYFHSNPEHQETRHPQEIYKAALELLAAKISRG